MNAKILLADDHTMFRDGLRTLLDKEPGFEVVAEAHDGRQAVSLAKQAQPDVVIMDVAMPDLNGMEATRQIKRVLPDVRVIGLSMHADRHFVAEMLKAGASGYLLKDAEFEELVTALKTVLAGGDHISPAIASVVVGEFVRQAGTDHGAPPPATPRGPTPREREVLQLLAEGNSTKEIAATLGVSVKTVETHRRQTMRKLKIYSVPGLVKYALREGLTTLDA